MLATPIEQMLGEPVDAAGLRAPRSRAAAPRAAALSLPLTISGVSAPIAAGHPPRGRRTPGAPCSPAPAAPRQRPGARRCVPGAAFAVGYSSGDLALGAIGTVAYVDGDQVWGFGHPLDSVGRRDLFLQDAYVYDIVNNPLGVGDLSTYKLAAPGQDIGTLLGDGIDARRPAARECCPTRSR